MTSQGDTLRGDSRTPPAGAPAVPAVGGGRYRIDGEIGRGGMGVVYRAFDRELNRHVAMKVLARGGEGHAARFVGEARATARLEHPGIVPVHEIGTTERGEPFFTMKLVQGRTLTEVIAAGEMTRFRLLQALVEVARAVFFAHERGVVHRDLKPQNVMIGPYGEVQVMDWGLAAESGAGAGSALVGTPAYMPPEQAEGRPATPAADVYALGAILYELLARRPPYEGGPSEVLARLLAAPPPDPRAVDPAIPRELDAICRKAMARDLAARYASAGALAEDIERYLEDRPVEAAAEGAPRRLMKFVRRHRLAAASAGAVAVVAAAVLGFVLIERAALKERERERVVGRSRAAARSAVEAFERARAAGEGSERLLGLGLAAVSAADGLAQLAPQDPEQQAAVFRAALGLGEVALEAKQWSLAASAFEHARETSVGGERAAAALASVAAERDRVAGERSRAVRRLLDEARSGALDRRPGGWEDALFGLVGLASPEAVSLVAAALDEASAARFAAMRETLLAVARPTPDEVRVGETEIAGLAEALERAGLDDPGSLAADDDVIERAAIRLAARLTRARSTRSAPGPRVGPWDSVAEAQAARAGPTGIRFARLCCEALGRMGVRDPAAIEALGRHLRCEMEPRRAVPAAIALCLLGGERAHALVMKGGEQHGHDPQFWHQVARFLPRLRGDVPVPATATALAWTTRGEARTAEGDFAGAEDDFGRALALDPKYVRALVERSEARFRRGDAAGARVDADRAVEVDPGCGPAYLQRAQVRASAGDVEGAIADLTRTIEVAPGQATAALSNRSILRAELGDLRGALDDAAEAVRLEPESTAAHLNLGKARTDSGDPAGAIEAYTRAIELDPAFAPAWEARGTARIKAGDAAGAAADFERATELGGNDPSSWLLRSYARYERGDFDGAIADATRVLELAPGMAKALALRAEARQEKGDLEGAIADLDAALERDPRQPASLANRASLRSKLGRPAEAIADFDASLAIRPDHPNTLVRRGLAWAQIDEPERAEADFTRALTVAPGFALAWLNRGWLRLRDGRVREALPDYDRALELTPRDAHALSNRAACRERVGDEQGALADLDAAIEVAPDWAVPWQSRGKLRLVRGEHAAAIADLTRALELDPRASEIFEARAEARSAAGDGVGAEEDRRRARELREPQPPTATGVPSPADAVPQWR